MKRCGLLGEKLGHSYSPAIHAELADYEYRLYEVAPEKLGEFLTGGGFDGMNVTIPYKKAVIPYCAELSPIAQKLQSVNVLVRREDGTLYGDNADAYGFAGMVRASGIQIDGKKTLVLGSGGASSTVCAVLEEMGARSVTIISRKGEDNYNNLDRHADAEVIVNTTPVGMYPNCGVSPVDLSLFPKLEGVLDIVYNPARTALVLQAEKLWWATASPGPVVWKSAWQVSCCSLTTANTEWHRIWRRTPSPSFCWAPTSASRKAALSSAPARWYPCRWAMP